MRQVIIYPGENGYWVAQCPSLPPCISQGKTKEEAIFNIQEAIELYLELLREEGRIIPEDKVDTVTLSL
ncbi:type II toxin-antitoxin system HicB family antitoxin [Geminocystis sp. GBBB08]|uniref:type II toxin-antitoxin system HicB family antitoxin n=1 Tax=Geminocystis sp. GBBB08 TaxID=2604140 RepID=UPI0027E30129|nr:type II toxin-antitoxin system HicB family antitoxin [Geminocystis sp. GBBB08]MBL1208347.1 type II toxin-antitoxin system HicB family antitoxin [Geminocystis sp. GBBB08]